MLLLREDPIRIDVRDSAVESIDWTSPRLNDRDFDLLLRLQQERHIHLELGMGREAAGIEQAMLIVWQVAHLPDITL